ncbi:homoserine O-succinyltransferase [Acidisphaera sp. S103]|uniref:homoserine O-acetyltransferase/O-succinyltransferase family protein n=1 Tax=Acidisphaera sp. S103 TaxID=1747223 RepID=UPI00131CCBF3|nr:homoserine O-succinyltransferase [Acidisphaera sp. S103]
MTRPDDSFLTQYGGESNRPLTIGLVNNASDRGLKSTERQFLNVLRAASNHLELKFRFFTCPEIRRSARPLSFTGSPYASVDELYDMPLNALIVTGMEPQATMLRDEPIQESLSRLADWAEEQAVPVIWSCLAAHAAVLHLDEIPRCRLPAKLSGVFECDIAAADHRLMAGLPSRWAMPHSRYNGLNEDLLIAKGYQILSRSHEAAVNIFSKQGATTFVFVQGHPEYDGDTLLREYNRDVGRFALGEKQEFPLAPKHYFTADLEATLNELRENALQGRPDPAILGVISKLVGNQAHSNTWHIPAIQFYANWLTAIARDDLRNSSSDRTRFCGKEQRLWANPAAAEVASIQ